MYFIDIYAFILMFSYVICLEPINNNNNQIIEECKFLNLPLSKVLSKFTVELFYNENQIVITSKNGARTESTLRLTNKKTHDQYCSHVKENFIYNITKSDIGRTFLLEYQNGDETRNILFKIPQQQNNGTLKNQHIFCYIDITDQSQLILKFQPLPKIYDISAYKVEVWRQDDIKNRAQDLRFISHNNETLSLNYYTYNEGGNYYFTITAVNEKCPEDSCLMSTSPLAHVDNKTSSLVIGMCGASLILSMAICLFHITAKRYQSSETSLEPSRKILIVYQSSSKKHNAVVSVFIRLFQKISDMRVLVDVIPKANIKQPEKLCEDTLMLCNEIYYITPPIYEEIQEIEFLVKDKSVTNIIFEHCSEKLPTIMETFKCYKFMDEFNNFLEDRNLVDKITLEEAAVYGLNQRLDEAIEETNAIVNSELLPMIVVTDDPRDNDDDDDNQDGLLLH